MAGSNKQKNENSEASVFSALNLPEIMNFLKIDVSARTNGMMGFPEEKAKPFDPTEQTIIGHFKRLVTTEVQNANKLISQINNKIESIGSREQIGRIENIENEFRLKSSQMIEKAKTELPSLKRKALQTTEEWICFQVDNGLDQRSADYPTSRWLQVSVLFAVILVETILNASFFRVSSDFGWFGGITEAFVISVLNVGLAGIAGFFALRYSHHISKGKKIAGILSFSGLIVLAFHFHLFVAHYRDQLTIDPEMGYRAALSALMETYLVLQNGQSYYLFLMTIIIFVVSCVDWYSMDDVYPRYGNIDRKKVQAEENYIEARRHIFDEIVEIKDSLRREIATIAKDIRWKLDQMRDLSEKKQNIYSAFPDQVKYICESCNIVLDSYRQKNAFARVATSKIPKYFDDAYSFEKSYELKEETSEDKKKIEEHETTVRNAFKKKETCENSIETDFKSCIIEMSKIDAYFGVTEIPETEGSA